VTWASKRKEKKKTSLIIFGHPQPQIVLPTEVPHRPENTSLVPNSYLLNGTTDFFWQLTVILFQNSKIPLHLFVLNIPFYSY